MPEHSGPRRPAGPARIRVGDVIAVLEPDLGPGADQTGGDDAGAARVRVRAEGGVAAVEIAARWRERVEGVDGLGAAILTAYRRASRKRMAVLLHSVGLAAAPEVPDGRELGRVRDALDRSERLLTAMGQAWPEAAEVFGPCRYVRVRVAGGVVTDVFVDAPLAALRSPAAVAADTRRALDQAAAAIRSSHTGGGRGR
jgi:hypothetical protein